MVSQTTESNFSERTFTLGYHIIVENTMLVSFDMKFISESRNSVGMARLA